MNLLQIVPDGELCAQQAHCKMLQIWEVQNQAAKIHSQHLATVLGRHNL